MSDHLEVPEQYVPCLNFCLCASLTPLCHVVKDAIQRKHATDLATVILLVSKTLPDRGGCFRARFQPDSPQLSSECRHRAGGILLGLLGDALLRPVRQRKVKVISDDTLAAMTGRQSHSKCWWIF